MTIKKYQIDAFTNEVFKGNPAAVCPLENWLPDEVLQQIAMEHNLSETVFYVRKGDEFTIRWFTPKVEVDLCGHATLATAFVLFYVEGYQSDTIKFWSPRSGRLKVCKDDGLLTLDFPADLPKSIELTDDLKSCFNHPIDQALTGRSDLLLVFEDEDIIRDLIVDIQALEKLPHRGVIATSGGKEVDFVSRFFAPSVGIDEDPVTGSAHTLLTPYWSKQLKKQALSARQLSHRGGSLSCRLVGERVKIGGQAVLFEEGFIHINPMK